MSSPTLQHIPISELYPRPSALMMWERTRHRKVNWLVELIAEATGTFIYTFAGAGSTAAYICGNILQIAGLGSLFQIGVAYSVGIALAIAVCVPTSRGHFNPALTVHAIIFHKFPVMKGLRYIAAQIFGAYIASLLIYVQYKQIIHLSIEALQAAGKYEEVMFTSSGPAGIFAFYVPAGTNLGYVVLNEFVCDFILGLVIFACTSPSNHFATPATMPWLIGLAYGVVTFGFAPVGLAANAARDLGGRFAAMTLFGRAASGGKYAAIAALTNIPATLIAGVFYELVFNDSTRTMNPEWLHMLTGMKAEMQRKAGGDVTPSLHGSTGSDEKVIQA
ncbi:aquaporin-like protein [Lentinus tigrinus ALCF2SS1-7]|uniref:aquaporin-like protein n=1 Tax=Lentinus tigrinus ALCF2SS1-7 TaxID=1328758 RepID=UPI001165CEE0|nr:aquaporin-like protein [Lentinus tigrinus ALCF2SS1-7]